MLRQGVVHNVPDPPFPDFLSPKYRGYALRDAWLSVGVCVGVRLRIRLRLKPRLILLGL